ncbi:MAG: Gfo/Idh/MocA family oxidoreductase [Bacteroidales bacterium]|nr:Gfo/Idh/MocA family oxidoreductase [Bacteroidales bacterium]HOY39451.1 Gfo/Idh/MocA family oxidoreductase [Bacteroidales bacterium]HQP04467.1 Gfo/Idh/MocA family oxidoreductase [Bacteroidales bacterium]
MIRTGIIGSEQIWQGYVESINNIGELRLVGFFDPAADSTIRELSGVKPFAESDSLLHEVDAVIALSPMSSAEHIENYVRNSKHVLFEPVQLFSKSEASRLMNMIDEADVKVQPGFDKRYNMVFRAVRPFIKNPRIIVSNHFVQYDVKTRNTSVLIDILLNDIDLVLSLVNSEIKSISATGVSINNTSPDTINARIEFNNKCVAQFNAGRVALEEKNEITFYHNNNYVYANLSANSAMLVRKNAPFTDLGLFSSLKGELQCEPILIPSTDEKYSSIKAFASAIVKNTSPEVNLESMMRTFSAAQIIAEKLKLVSH